MRLDSLGTLFGNAWKHFRQRFSVAMSIYIIPAVLLCIGQLLAKDKGSSAALLLSIPINIIAVIATLLAAIALISTFGKGTDFAASYATGFKLFWSSIWIAILILLATVGGLVMLIIPGIMLAVQLSLSTFMLVLEDKRGIAALAASREYMKGYWWAFVGRMLLLILGLLVVLLVLVAPAAILLGPIGAVIVYGIILLMFTPFSIAYEYEIFKNLKHLKPDASEVAAKSDNGFLKVAMVVGIVGAAFFLVLVVALAVFFPTLIAKWQTQYPNGYQYQYPPAMGTSISPTSGPVGSSVTISGIDTSMIGATETVLMDNLIAARDVPVSAAGTLTFTVPQTLGPNCDPDQVCPQFLMDTSPKTYSISIEQNAKDPNPTSEGTFTVVGNSIGTQDPGGPIQPVQPQSQPVGY